ncbi:MAG: hypothetical protein FJ297_17520 [Planctomycetes bacterium]|nr:hypothetical protein [Planctomycetota bacterium]
MNVLASLAAPAATGAAVLAPIAARGLRILGEVASGSGFRGLFARADPPGDPARPTTRSPGGVEDAIREFHGVLFDRLLGEGIDPTEPIEIGRSPFGDLTVVNGHSRLLDVERLLSETPALSELYDRIARIVGEASAGMDGLATGETPSVDLVWQPDGAAVRVR